MENYLFQTNFIEENRTLAHLSGRQDLSVTFTQNVRYEFQYV